MSRGIREVEEWFSFRDVIEAHAILDWKEKITASEIAKRKLEMEMAQRVRRK